MLSLQEYKKTPLRSTFCGGAFSVLKEINNEKTLEVFSSVFFICNYFYCPYTKLANIGKIPNFEHLITTIRSRNMSVTIIIQSFGQLKALYKEEANTIFGNCNSILFLGNTDQDTLKMFSEMLGKETIDQYNTSRSRGASESFSTSYQKLGKELMSPSELRKMDGTLCILLIKGVFPFRSKKFDPTTHKNYRKLSDFDPKNTFDVENYLEQQKNCYAKIRKNDVITMYKV